MIKHQGFTLIELVIVLVILSILSSIVIPRYVDLSDSVLSTAQLASSGAVKSCYAISVAQEKGNVTLDEIIADCPDTSASDDNTGIDIVIDEDTYTVPTYTDNTCTTPTSSGSDIVLCIGEI